MGSGPTIPTLSELWCSFNHSTEMLDRDLRLTELQGQYPLIKCCLEGSSLLRKLVPMNPDLVLDHRYFDQVTRLFEGPEQPVKLGLRLIRSHTDRQRY